MSGNTPTVSVVMGVYNGMPWLVSAVESVQAQTYRDFEMIVVDDGSTDGSEQYLCRASRSDHRIRVHRNPENLGLTTSLNVGLSFARGKWIARQDADDVSLPDRLAKQCAFLGENEEVGLLGSACELVDESRQTGTVQYTPPLTHTSLRWHILFDNPFVHTSVMFRRLLDGQPVAYDQRLRCAQDYELWTRMAGRCRLANLGETLVRRREHDSSISRTRRAEQTAVADAVSDNAMRALLPELSDGGTATLREWFRAFPTVLGDEGIVDAIESLQLLRTFGGLPGLDCDECRAIRLRWCRRVLSAVPDYRWKRALRKGLVPKMFFVAPGLVVQDLRDRLRRRYRR